MNSLVIFPNLINSILNNYLHITKFEFVSNIIKRTVNINLFDSGEYIYESCYSTETALVRAKIALMCFYSDRKTCWVCQVWFLVASSSVLNNTFGGCSSMLFCLMFYIINMAYYRVPILII